MTIKKLLLPLLSIMAIVPAQAQSIAISNNALFDAVGALSAGIEIPLSGSTSWELYGSVRPWKRGNNSVHKHLAAQTQLRLWPCQVMNGFYWGPYAHVAQFNIANQGFPLSIFKNLESNRYEGWLVGGGIGVGYEYVLAKHWNIGAEIGAGYTYIDYKKSETQRCGKLKADDDRHYIGISKLGLSVIYLY